MTKYDYGWLVIGSGFGGRVAALRLAEKPEKGVTGSTLDVTTAR
jgi:choline dehydrogenase-like flavoprotein